MRTKNFQNSSYGACTSTNINYLASTVPNIPKMNNGDKSMLLLQFALVFCNY